MEPLYAILVGLAIGMQLTAIYFIYKIMTRHTIATLPYIFIGTSLLITTITRVDNFVHFLTLNDRTIVLTTASLLIMIGFGYMYVYTRKL